MNHVQEQYAQWLSNEPWHYFFTGTFREDYSSNSARRAGERFFGKVTRPELALLFIERGELYGKIHLHGLLRYPSCRNRPTARSVWELWYERYGRAKVEVPRSNQNVANYVSKYVLKHAKNETWFVV